MRYYRIKGESGPRLVIETDDVVHDITAVRPRIDRFIDVARAANVSNQSIDSLTADLVKEAPSESLSTLAAPLRPCIPSEVWAAGVTYQISEEAREAESGLPEVYMKVYESERPEIFLKATPSRIVGPDEDIGVRGDSDWNTPEPELGIVLYDGDPVGFTIGNDVSSRSIEGENPLYLPQAKVYDRSCSIGPCIATPETIGDPHDLRMDMMIERDGEVVFNDHTRTSLMDRTCEELVSYWNRHNAIPELGVMLTGTALVPEDEFSLREGDVVTIDIESIGRLVNPVITV